MAISKGDDKSALSTRALLCEWIPARGHAGEAARDDAGVGRTLAMNTVQWLLGQPTRIHSLDGIFLEGYVLNFVLGLSTRKGLETDG